MYQLLNPNHPKHRAHILYPCLRALTYASNSIYDTLKQQYSFRARKSWKLPRQFEFFGMYRGHADSERSAL